MLSDVSGVYLIVVFGSILISLGIHEAMHAFTSHWLGDDTAYHEGRLTLNPLAHIDLFTTIILPMVLIISHLPPILAAKPVPFNPARLRYGEFGAALVGVAGPLTNLALAAIGAAIFHLTLPEFGGFAYKSLIIFIEINIAFFVFNMIPFPPLDGSRLLYAVAPEPLREIMEQIEAAGFLIILLVFVFAFQFIAGPIVHIENSLIDLLL